MNIGTITDRIKTLTKKQEELNELSRYVCDINYNLRHLKARQQLDQFKIDYPLPNPYIDQCKELQNEIDQLNKQLADIRKAKAKPIESFYIKAKRVSTGTTTDSKSKVIGVQLLPNGKCNALVYVPGYKEYVNRMTGYAYSPSRIFVMIDAEVDHDHNIIRGSIWGNHLKNLTEDQVFRLTNRGLMQYEAEIKKYISNFVALVPPKGYTTDYNSFEQSGK